MKISGYLIQWYYTIKVKYNRMIEAQIIANLHITAGAARTKYGAELFYIDEIKSSNIRRGFYNILHRLFTIESEHIATANSELDVKVRYTLFKIATALRNQ